MRAFRTILIVAVAMESFAVQAHAGPRSPRERQKPVSQAEPSAPEGIEFADPLVGECMARMRSGDAIEAMTRLEKASAQAVGEQSAELKLGLGMLYLRSHQKNKALGVLRGLTARQDAGTLGLRAKLLMRVANGKRSSVKNSEDLLSEEAWTKALTSAAKDISKEVASEHQKLVAAIGKEEWAKVGVQLSKAQNLVREAGEIKAGDAASDVLTKHIDGLTNEVRIFNGELESGIVTAKQLYEDVNAFERPRRHKLPGSPTPNPNAKIELNRLVERLHNAWQAAHPIDEELERLLEETGGGPRMRKAARLMSRGKLPVIRS